MLPPLYVEVSPLLDRRLTGIGRFAARLVEALAHLVPLRLVTTASRQQAYLGDLLTDLVRGDEIAIESGSVADADGDVAAWTRALLRRPHTRHRPELSRQSACVYTLVRPDGRHFRREISVLYDFTPLLLPWAHEQWVRKLFGASFSRSVPQSDKAVAISQSTKADASWLCALSPDDVVVAYPGPSLCVGSHAHRGTVERARRLILVVSTREPRKNAPFVVDWFLNTQVVEPDAALVWVGREGWLWQQLETGAKRRRHGRSVKFVGTVSDAHLCKLYRQATCTIYPSLYEGFGFPVLDSLHHGTPVACSFNSALKEFAGPGVFYFDPCDPASLDRAYVDLCASGPSPVERADLRQTYSWQSLARTIVALCT